MGDVVSRAKIEAAQVDNIDGPMSGFCLPKLFRSTRQLEAAIRDYLDHHNAQPNPFVWTKSADDILSALAKIV
jgi:hypothetical protein